MTPPSKRQRVHRPAYNSSSATSTHTATLLSNVQNIMPGAGDLRARNEQNLQSPLSSIIESPDDSSLANSSSSSSAGDDCQLSLEEDDLKCLEPGSELSHKIINAVLCLLSALHPFTVKVIDSLSQVPIPSDDWLQAVDEASSRPIILIPIYFPPSDPSIGHWLLAVLDSGGARLLDSLPGDAHTQFAKERMEMLFREQPMLWPDWGSINETECARQETGSIECGVAVLVNAIYFVAASLGSGIELPKTLDAALWRDALALLLKTTMGQTSYLHWANEFDNMVRLEGRQAEGNNEWMHLYSSDPVFVDYKAARNELIQQLERLDAAAAKERAKKVTMARQGAYIHVVLDSLSKSATLQEKQVESLQTERERCEKGLGKLLDLEELLEGSLFTMRMDQTDTLRNHLRSGLQNVNICLARRERMVIALSEGVKAVGQAVKMLEDNTE